MTKNKLFRLLNKKSKGFTVLELLIVIAIMAILAFIVFRATQRARNEAYLTEAKVEFTQIVGAMNQYLNEYSFYPPDVNRGLPNGIEQYLNPGRWPQAPWPGSEYDWDNWLDPITGEEIYQISIRFCLIGQPSTCRFPDEPWAANFDIHSALYYCILGPCRSHLSKPINHPGYCINCTN